MNEQAENQRRVTARVENAILAFVGHVSTSPSRQFHMTDLTAYVSAHLDGFVAPDSPGRVLRHMRKIGRVDVVLLDRASSLYEVGSSTP